MWGKSMMPTPHLACSGPRVNLQITFFFFPGQARTGHGLMLGDGARSHPDAESMGKQKGLWASWGMGEFLGTG